MDSKLRYFSKKIPGYADSPSSLQQQSQIQREQSLLQPFSTNERKQTGTTNLQARVNKLKARLQMCVWETGVSGRGDVGPKKDLENVFAKFSFSKHLNKASANA